MNSKEVPMSVLWSHFDEICTFHRTVQAESLEVVAMEPYAIGFAAGKCGIALPNAAWATTPVRQGYNDGRGSDVWNDMSRLCAFYEKVKAADRHIVVGFDPYDIGYWAYRNGIALPDEPWVNDRMVQGRDNAVADEEDEIAMLEFDEPHE